MIFDKLEKVTKTAGCYIAICPNCKDPSLTLSLNNPRENVIINCINECRHGDIMRSIGMDVIDLYPGVKRSVNTLVAARAKRERRERLTAQEMKDEMQAWRALG